MFSTFQLRRTAFLRRSATLGAVCFLCSAELSEGQSPSTNALAEFEVASVKPVKPGARPAPGWQDAPTGRQNGLYLQPNISLQVCLQIAYQLPGYRIKGPAWMATRRYDIAARMPSATSDDQVLQMFQRLLAERFRLMFHWSEQPTKAYALEVDKKGAKLNP